MVAVEVASATSMGGPHGGPNDLAGISELRSSDQRLLARHIWELHAEPDDTSGIALLRFGTVPEVIFHAMMRLLALVDLAWVPFALSFDCVASFRTSLGGLAGDVTLVSLFAVGVLLRLHTSFLDPINIVERTDLRSIRRSMLRDVSFCMDVLALLVAPLIYCNPPWAYFAMLRLLKCWRLPQNSQRTMLLSLTGSSLMSQLSQIALGITLVAHLYSCIWFYAKASTCSLESAGTSAVDVADLFDNSWCEEKGLEDFWGSGNSGELGRAYVCSLNEGTAMLVGWGPSWPSTRGERSVLIIGGLLSLFVTCYVQGLCIAAVNRASILESRFSERAAVLNAACSDMRLKGSLHYRVCQYHSYLALHHMGQDAQELFGELSTNLLSETRMHRMHDVILSADIFQGLSSRLTIMLVFACVEMVFSPGDIIVRKGEVGDCAFIVLRGTCSVLPDDECSVAINRLVEHDCFGEMCLLRGGTVRGAWIRADSFTVVARLDKDRFETILDGHPDMKRRMLDHIQNRLQSFQFPHQKTMLPCIAHPPSAPESETTPLLSERGDADGDANCELASPTALPEHQSSQTPEERSPKPGMRRAGTTIDVEEVPQHEGRLKAQVRRAGTTIDVVGDAAGAPRGRTAPMSLQRAGTSMLCGARVACRGSLQGSDTFLSGPAPPRSSENGRRERGLLPDMAAMVMKRCDLLEDCLLERLTEIEAAQGRMERAQQRVEALLGGQPLPVTGAQDRPSAQARLGAALSGLARRSSR